MMNDVNEYLANKPFIDMFEKILRTTPLVNNEELEKLLLPSANLGGSKVCELLIKNLDNLKDADVKRIISYLPYEIQNEFILNIMYQKAINPEKGTRLQILYEDLLESLFVTVGLYSQINYDGYNTKFYTYLDSLPRSVMNLYKELFKIKINEGKDYSKELEYINKRLNAKNYTRKK